MHGYKWPINCTRTRIEAPLVDRTSARANRFSEEVIGWQMQGITGGYGDRVPLWLTPLPNGLGACTINRPLITMHD